MNQQAPERTDTPVLELQPRPAQPLTAAPAVPAGELSVVQYMVQSGATPEQVHAALELQVRADNHKLEMMREKRRMDEEDRKAAAARAFDAAMVAFRGRNVVVPKTKLVQQTARGGGPGPTFMQSEFDVVCSMISPPLSECGLSFRHDQKFGVRDWIADGTNPAILAGTAIVIPWVTVTCYLTHRDGHVETLTLEGPPDTSGAKNPLQEMQSTASYLKRQSLLSITGTATGGEDDENKFRKRGSGRAEQDEGERESLLDAGRDAALGGMKSLTAWWGALTAKQRSSLNAEFAGLRKAAIAADHGVSHG